MAREMTPQERAAAVYRDLGDGCDLSAPEQEKRDIETIAAAFTATRQAALLEAAEVAEKCKNDSALGRVRDAYSYVEANLRKLAQEG